jgi:hypothetical protein
MPTPILKLVDPDQYPPESFLMERRQNLRHPTTGHVTAVACGNPNDDAEATKRICSLEMLNLSDIGLGAIVDEPVEIGSRISVFFPPHGPEQGFDVYGTVVRCIGRDAGHEIGVQIQPRLAA